jgi:hypothetical protein
MNKTTKTILFVVGGVALAVGGYFLYKKFAKGSSGSSVDDKKVTAETKQNTIQLVRA